MNCRRSKPLRKEVLHSRRGAAPFAFAKGGAVGVMVMELR
jgi:hypothetical protein